MGVYEDNIVPVKIANLAEYVSERKRISLDEALVYIYTNDMYEPSGGILVQKLCTMSLKHGARRKP